MFSLWVHARCMPWTITKYDGVMVKMIYTVDSSCCDKVQFSKDGTKQFLRSIIESCLRICLCSNYIL